MAPIPRLRTYAGPALLSYGFRPFFLFGSIYSGIAVLVWLPMFYRDLSVSTAFLPRDWHAHEMLYGYVAAVVAGFLLTAIPNWTGRLPIQGVPLLLLVAVWAAGRVAVMSSALIGWLAAAIIDVAFLALVAAAATREILAGRNWGNLKVLVLLAVLVAGNVAFHVEAHYWGAAEYSIRLGLVATIMLLMTIGGRLVPSFTRNWLVRESRTAAGSVRPVRYCNIGAQRCGTRIVDRGAGCAPDRSGAACWRGTSGCAARPLGRRPYAARPARAECCT